MMAAPLQAQRLFLHIDGGAVNYGGDLQDKLLTLNQANSALGFGLDYKVTGHLSVSASFMSGKLSASDAKSNTEGYRRNLSFYTNITEGSLVFQLSLKDVPAGAKFAPYAFGGIAVFHFDPYAYTLTGTKTFLQPLGTEGQGLPQYPERKQYSLTQVALPFGAGIKYAVNDNFMIGAEVGFRKLFTDHLDDVSSAHYADTALLRAARGSLAAKMSFRSDETDNPYDFSNKVTRGNPNRKDAYYSFMARVYISLSALSNGRGSGYSKKAQRRMGCPAKVQ